MKILFIISAVIFGYLLITPKRNASMKLPYILLIGFLLSVAFAWLV